MNRSDRVRYEMLKRTQDFGAAHEIRFPESSLGARAFADMARIVASIETQAADRIVAVRESRRTKADRRRLILKHMKTIVRTSRVIQSTSGAPLHLTMPTRTSDTAIITAARAFLREVAPYEDQLLVLGLGADARKALGDTVDVFEAALKGRRAGRSTVASAEAGLKAALAEGARVARTLDVIVANVLGDDPAAVAAWQRSRRLVTWEGKNRPADVAPQLNAVPAVVESPAEKPEAPADPLRRAS